MISGEDDCATNQIRSDQANQIKSDQANQINKCLMIVYIYTYVLHTRGSTLRLPGSKKLPVAYDNRPTVYFVQPFASVRFAQERLAYKILVPRSPPTAGWITVKAIHSRVGLGQLSGLGAALVGPRADTPSCAWGFQRGRHRRSSSRPQLSCSGESSASPRDARRVSPRCLLQQSPEHEDNSSHGR